MRRRGRFTGGSDPSTPTGGQRATQYLRQAVTTPATVAVPDPLGRSVTPPPTDAIQPQLPGVVGVGDVPAPPTPLK